MTAFLNSPAGLVRSSGARRWMIRRSLVSQSWYATSPVFSIFSGRGARR